MGLKESRYDMKLELPDDVIHRAEVTVRELRLGLAIQLYVDHRINHQDACQLAGIASHVFNRELTGRDIGVHVYPEALQGSERRAG